MNRRDEPLLCSLCNQSINLELDRCTDEAGKSVHEICYVRKVVPISQEMAGPAAKLPGRNSKRVS
jgi:hypothetical protein